MSKTYRERVNALPGFLHIGAFTIASDADAEIARLTAERDGARMLFRDAVEKLEKAASERDAAREERGALRKALELISEAENSALALAYVSGVARAAIAKDKP